MASCTARQRARYARPPAQVIIPLMIRNWIRRGVPRGPWSISGKRKKPPRLSADATAPGPQPP
jgi:hypothetical protein